LDSTAIPYEFVPAPNFGAKSPKLEGQTCFGVDLHEIDLREFRAEATLDLSQLIDFYENMGLGSDFFLSNNFIDLLAGTSNLRKAIIDGADFQTMKNSWAEDLDVFKTMRSKYLLYSVD
jgi:uncharacterized protein YbbC (DUF1343 family)